MSACSDDEDCDVEVGCYCPTCYFEGECLVAATRAKELNELDEFEENDDHPYCYCTAICREEEEDEARLIKIQALIRGKNTRWRIPCFTFRDEQTDVSERGTNRKRE
jgi:hypothetical protein